MRNRKLLVNLALFAVAVAALAGSQVLFHPEGPTPAFAVTEQCPDGGTKFESGPWEFDCDGTVTSVCIKAGTETFVFNSDGSDGCYTVDGIGTDHVEVSGGGTGRDCKEISHVVFYGCEPDASPSPEPSPEPSPDPTPEPSPEPTP